ncbi:MAG: TatD family hydrolase [Campylobacterales bacterium]|nr:TatD family hydrolase [Campylobacterales bacterium]
MIIDTHVHLDSDRYNEDIKEVYQRSLEAGVEQFIIPGADPADFERAGQLSLEFENTYIASGVHPYHVDDYDLPKVEKFASLSTCVAIGECGLDYYRLPETKEEIEKEKTLQKKVFISQIKLAKKLQKPLIVHIREASLDSLTILKETNAKDVGGVLHCYNADEILLELVDHNFYFGIGGVLTFKNAKKLPEMVKKIPLDRLLIETDGPYLTPHPHRGKRNEPAYCTFVAQKIAEILEMEVDEIKRITTENAKRLFKI